MHLLHLHIWKVHSLDLWEQLVYKTYGIIYDNKDGCIKQYIFANAMLIFYVFLFKYIVIIDIWINDPVHGINKIYGINGSVKTYPKQKMLMIGTEKSNNDSMITNVDSMICDKKNK